MFNTCDIPACKKQLLTLRVPRFITRVSVVREEWGNTRMGAPACMSILMRPPRNAVAEICKKVRETVDLTCIVHTRGRA